MEFKQRKKKTLLHYPAVLRGLPNNRYGGYQSTRLRTYHQQLPWSSHGECRIYTEGEKRERAEIDERKQGASGTEAVAA